MRHYTAPTASSAVPLPLLANAAHNDLGKTVESNPLPTDHLNPLSVPLSMRSTRSQVIPAQAGIQRQELDTRSPGAQGVRGRGVTELYSTFIPIAPIPPA